jgi:hypothetical protein
MAQAVADSSSLIHLEKIGQLPLLASLLEHVAIPQAVADEVQKDPPGTAFVGLRLSPCCAGGGRGQPAVLRVGGGAAPSAKIGGIPRSIRAVALAVQDGTIAPEVSDDDRRGRGVRRRRAQA